MKKRWDLMEHLFNHMREVDERLQVGAILLFDYDGTLAPIVERPELAILSPDIKASLKQLTKRFKVAVISGRSLGDVKKLVGLKGIYYVGNHGFEISGPGAQLVQPQAKRARQTIHNLCAELRSKLRKIPGVIVENKGLTASVHYRLVARKKLGHMKIIFDEVTKHHISSGAIRVITNKKVLEIRPNVAWDKGKAVLWIIGAVDQEKRLTPVYVGDDKTDEDAFLALKNMGITVLVSNREKKSRAKFFLRNVDEVKIFLEKLAAEGL